ncbi:MAG TPA: NAD(P)/FAD-dependent oxidoreductase, partial [Flavobacterium sp.]|nr:NAD(P)/FAD-dependent oxidoreductase [Flavobacterium sp.]
MEQQGMYDVIIIGGSYAGLSAALSLGRSLRKVLVLDSGNPCNRVTPYSHNFLTNDGSRPKAIHDKARAQLKGYLTVTYLEGLVTSASQLGNLFEVSTAENQVFSTKKLLFTTGVTDTIPNIQGFAECWGISILHCPYC